MAKPLDWTDQAKADIRAIDQQPALQILKTLSVDRNTRSIKNNTINQMQ